MFLNFLVGDVKCKCKMRVQAVVFDFPEIRFIRLIAYGVTNSTKVDKVCRADKFL